MQCTHSIGWPDSKPDVMIAGAGIIGASIAWRLAQRGARVLLVDAGQFGGEASSAAAGMLAPGGEIEHAGRWAELSVSSLRQYPDFVSALTAETGLNIDLRLCGAFEVAMDHAELAAAGERAKVRNTLGIRVEEWKPPLPINGLAEGVVGAYFYPDDGLIDPLDVLPALRSACLARGVVIREMAPVLQVLVEESSVGFQFAREAVWAPAAVLAAGAWSGGLSVRGTTLFPSHPVKGHLISYVKAPGSLPYIVRRQHTYILQRSSGLTIAGSTEQRIGFDRSVDAALVKDLEVRAAALVPGLLAGARPERSWVGFRPGSESCDPVVARVPEGPLWCAYGHYRNGILLAPATADLVCESLGA